MRNPLLVEALRFLFEAVWESAVPILRTFTGEPDLRRQMLVSMLMVGATDAAIAKSLDANVRSVAGWPSSWTSTGYGRGCSSERHWFARMATVPAEALPGTAQALAPASTPRAGRRGTARSGVAS